MKVSVVVPNWNGADSLGACLDSLLTQTQKAHIIVVENGSHDGSLEFLKKNYPEVEVLANDTNLGFAGGVNAGIRRVLERGDEFVALFNNDAVANGGWLMGLLETMEKHTDTGIVTCKLMSIDKKHLDSTGDLYTSWGLPFPRGRGEAVSDMYDKKVLVFAASGGASLYRLEMIRHIGLFDEDFFAYYEDVDLSFRAQLAGWKVRYEPRAIAYHQIGATSGKIKGFTTYQTMKNLPLLLWKNVPSALLPTVLPRFCLAYAAFIVSAIQRRQASFAFKGLVRMVTLLPKKTADRWYNLNNRTVTVDYIHSIITYDLPPSAQKLRTLRDKWHTLW